MFFNHLICSMPLPSIQHRAKGSCDSGDPPPPLESLFSSVDVGSFVIRETSQILNVLLTLKHVFVRKIKVTITGQTESCGYSPSTLWKVSLL